MLIPGIPYDVETVADASRERMRGGQKFSIVAIAEGALTRVQASNVEAVDAQKREAMTKEDKKRAKTALISLLFCYPYV